MTARRAVGMAVFIGLAAGCSDPGEVEKDTTDVVDEDTGGGSTGDQWRPSGSGTAYFLDGSADNSLFHLELSRCTPPADGEAYYGWLSKGGEDAIALGAIPVTGEDVFFEYDIGRNAVIAGYDTFEAWATDNGGVAMEGQQLWVGQVDPVIYDVIQGLLISSDATPDGQGSLRSVETAIQDIRTVAEEAISRPFETDTFTAAAESVTNSIDGTDDDLNGDGTVDRLPDQLGILDDAGYVELIFDDLANASAQVDPGDPIKDYIQLGYDCIQVLETHADAAARNSDVATACLAEESCVNRMTDALEEINAALDGADDNEDGTVDVLTEGTLECAILYVSQMVQMTVDTP